MKILIPVLVGSLIGYLTNWLAIKMLFKPHYEKKIFGITIPFTPGLIPKERKRMAENIGNAVGTHLLSPDTIIDSISNEKNEEKIKKWIKEKIEKLRQDTTTVREYLQNIIGESYNHIEDDLKSKLSIFIINFIRKKEVKDRFKSIIDENIDNYKTHDLYDNIEIKAKETLNLLRNSGELKIEVERVLEKKLEEGSNNTNTLGQTIPNNVYVSIDKYIDNHKDEIGDNLRAILGDREVKENIKQAISKLVVDRSNKLIMAFISPDMISDKIFESIEKYIEKRETNEDIVAIIKFFIEKTKTKTVSSIFTGIKNITDEVSIEAISKQIISLGLDSDNIDKLVDKTINILKDNENIGKEALKKYIWIEVDRIIYSKDIENKINYMVKETIDRLMNKTISYISIKLNNKILLNIYDFAKEIIEINLKDKLPKMIERLNVSKIVEDKINSFEIDYTEKLILDIAKKELNQITRLGALLGGILGLLSPFLQYIY